MDVARSSRRPIVVTIDGPAGAGKSTVAKRLTTALGYRLLDTGALYRSIALLARRAGVPWSDEAAVAAIAAGLDVEFQLEGMTNRVLVAGEDVSAAIRTPESSEGSSIVSAMRRPGSIDSTMPCGIGMFRSTRFASQPGGATYGPYQYLSVSFVPGAFGTY